MAKQKKMLVSTLNSRTEIMLLTVLELFKYLNFFNEGHGKINE